MHGIDHVNPAALSILLLTAGLLAWQLKRVRQGYVHYIRRIPGVDAIEGAVGRCAELGRPVVFTTGLTDVGPVLYACLGVLHSVARRVAQYKLPLKVPQYAPEAMAIVEDTVREAYRDVGRGGAFDPSSIVFLSSEQFAFASGYMGLVHRENAGACFLFGVFMGEALVLAEAGQQVGARQVAASVSPEQVAFFICACDYTLIGEELFAASAYMSREPVQVATLATQDRVKLFWMAVIVVGVVASTYASIVTGGDPSAASAAWSPASLLTASWDVFRWWGK